MAPVGSGIKLRGQILRKIGRRGDRRDLRSEVKSGDNVALKFRIVSFPDRVIEKCLIRGVQIVRRPVVVSKTVPKDLVAVKDDRKVDVVQGDGLFDPFGFCGKVKLGGMNSDDLEPFVVILLI
jgi:hypothetical protein